MTTAIGVVMTEHIVSGRLENHQLTGSLLRYPQDSDEVDALASIPGGELVETLAEQVATLAGTSPEPVDAIGIAVPGVIRHGVVEDSPNLTQIKGMRLADGAKDTRAFRCGTGGFEDNGAGAIAVDHAVPVARVNDPA